MRIRQGTHQGPCRHAKQRGTILPVSANVPNSAATGLVVLPVTEPFRLRGELNFTLPASWGTQLRVPSKQATYLLATRRWKSRRHMAR